MWVYHLAKLAAEKKFWEIADANASRLHCRYRIVTTSIVGEADDLSQSYRLSSSGHTFPIIKLEARLPPWEAVSSSTSFSTHRIGYILPIRSVILSTCGT